MVLKMKMHKKCGKQVEITSSHENCLHKMNEKYSKRDKLKEAGLRNRSSRENCYFSRISPFLRQMPATTIQTPISVNENQSDFNTYFMVILCQGTRTTAPMEFCSKDVKNICDFIFLLEIRCICVWHAIICHVHA